MAHETLKRRTFGLAAVLLAAALLWAIHSHLTFDWPALGRQLRTVSPTYILLGVAAIYFGLYLRAVRWAVLLGKDSGATGSAIFIPQLIGFTAVALLGKLADLVRPYLIARRLGLPVSSQLAAYSIERAFDLGSAACLFSLALLFAGQEHHAIYLRSGLVSLAATLVLAGFTGLLRVAGASTAAFAHRLVAPFSERTAHRLAARLLEFCNGLRILSTLPQFFATAVLSLLMWAAIAFAYCITARAFTAEPSLAGFSISATMLLLATSLGASLLQLPVIGWFTQIAVNAAALHRFFHVPLEPATACGALLLFVANLDVLPPGLLAARLQGLGLRQAVNASGEAVQSRTLPAGDR